MRNVVLANHDFHIDSEIILMSQDFNYSAACVLSARRPLSNFDIDDHAFKIGRRLPASLLANHAMPSRGKLRYRRNMRFLQVAAGDFHAWENDDRIGEFLVDRLNVVVAISVVEDSDYSRVSAPNNLDDPSFGPAISASRAQLDQHVVPVHRCVHLPS